MTAEVLLASAPVVITLADANIIYVEQGGVTKQLPASVLAEYIATKGSFKSGSYTPTFVAGSNCGAITAGEAHYIRQGRYVTVSGVVTITPTLANTITVFTMSLHADIAATFADNDDGAGLVTGKPTGIVKYEPGFVITNAGGVVLTFNIAVANAATAHTCRFHATYHIP